MFLKNQNLKTTKESAVRAHKNLRIEQSVNPI